MVSIALRSGREGIALMRDSPVTNLKGMVTRSSSSDILAVVAEVLTLRAYVEKAQRRRAFTEVQSSRVYDEVECTATKPGAPTHPGWLELLPRPDLSSRWQSSKALRSDRRAAKQHRGTLSAVSPFVRIHSFSPTESKQDAIHTLCGGEYAAPAGRDQHDSQSRSPNAPNAADEELEIAGYAEIEVSCARTPTPFNPFSIVEPSLTSKQKEEQSGQ